VRVAAGACCQYLPLELIPFADADYRQTIRVDLEEGGEAYLTEVVGPGRLWEHFRYRRLSFRTELRLGGELVALDAQNVVPEATDLDAALGGFSHFASLLHVGPAVGPDDADRLHERLAAANLCGSASLLPRRGISARVLGTSAHALLEALAPS
jgi:urease accessory protein UreH